MPFPYTFPFTFDPPPAPTPVPTVHAPSALPQPVTYRDFIIIWLPRPQTMINDRVIHRIDHAEKVLLPVPVSRVKDRVVCRELVMTQLAMPVSSIVDRLHSHWFVTTILPMGKSAIAERLRFGEKRRRMIAEYDKLLGIEE